MSDLVGKLRNVTEEDAYALPWTFGETCKEAADRIEQLERELAAMTQTFEFVVRQAWREDPPHANHKLTDTERLSAIKFYPRIKAAAQPHSETRQEQR